MRIRSRCWSNCWGCCRSGCRCSTAVASRGASIASDFIAARLGLEQLREQAELLARSTAGVTGRRSARIAVCNFATAVWSGVAWVARNFGTTARSTRLCTWNFDSTARTTVLSARTFNSAARIARLVAWIFATAIRCTRISTAGIAACMQTILETCKLALQTLEAVQNRCPSATWGCTRIAARNFRAAMRSARSWSTRLWANWCTLHFATAARIFTTRIATDDFSTAGWITNGGIAAGA